MAHGRLARPPVLLGVDGVVTTRRCRRTRRIADGVALGRVPVGEVGRRPSQEGFCAQPVERPLVAAGFARTGPRIGRGVGRVDLRDRQRDNEVREAVRRIAAHKSCGAVGRAPPPLRCGRVDADDGAAHRCGVLRERALRHLVDHTVLDGLGLLRRQVQRLVDEEARLAVGNGAVVHALPRPAQPPRELPRVGDLCVGGPSTQRQNRPELGSRRSLRVDLLEPLVAKDGCRDRFQPQRGRAVDDPVEADRSVDGGGPVQRLDLDAVECCEHPGDQRRLGVGCRRADMRVERRLLIWFEHMFDHMGRERQKPDATRALWNVDPSQGAPRNFSAGEKAWPAG